MNTGRANVLWRAAPAVLVSGLSCAPVDEDPDRVWRGDYELAGPNDLIQLLRLERIEGQLIIRSTAALQTLSLPGLVQVSGDLVVPGLPELGAPTRVELPNLVVLGGEIRLTGTGDPLTLSAPLLGRVDALRATEGAFAFELDGLLEVRGDIHTQDADITTMRFLRLERVGGSVILRRIESVAPTDPITVELPALAELGGRLDLRGTDEVALSAPVLESVGGDLRLDFAQASLQLDALLDVDGDLTVRQSTFDVQAPSLRRIRGRMTVDQAVFEGRPNTERRRSLTLAALTTVERAISVRRVQALEGLELPALTGVGGEVHVSEIPSLEVLDLAALGRVPAALHLRDLFQVELRAPELTRVDGPFVVRGLDTLTADLSKLESVGQSFELADFETRSLDLRALQQVQRSLTMQGLAVTGEIDVRSLRSVGVDLVFTDGAGFFTLDLPALETVGGGQGDGFGDFRVLRNFDLEAIEVPRLTEIRGVLEVRDNPVLDPEGVRESFEGVRTSARTVCGNADGPRCRAGD